MKPGKCMATLSRNATCAVGVCLLMVGLAFADSGTVPILDGDFKAENDRSTRKSVMVTTVKYHPVSSVYVVRGRVRYQNVEGDAHLEMWNVMPDGSRYFSRTMMDIGSMQKIQGTSDWRVFELPFNLMDSRPESVTLEINIVMPGKGTIEVSGLTIGDAQRGGRQGSEWWDKRKGGILERIIGSVVGIFGGLIGCLVGIFAPRGKGRKWIFGLVIFGIVTGFALLMIGVVALCLAQPRHVWYPFVICGGVMSFGSAGVLLIIRRAYALVERRRMEALDL